MSTIDLYSNLGILFLGFTFATAYYTKLIFRYAESSWDMVMIWLIWTSLGIAGSMYGAYNILTAASLPVL